MRCSSNRQPLSSAQLSPLSHAPGSCHIVDDFEWLPFFISKSADERDKEREVGGGERVTDIVGNAGGSLPINDNSH